MRRLLAALAVALVCFAQPTFAQPAFAQQQAGSVQVDARAEVAAALYAASATQAASERQADAQLRVAQAQIARLQAEGGTARAQLIAAQESYVVELAGRDRAYSEAIAVFRQSVEFQTTSPERLAALHQYNVGDRARAIDILDELDAAAARANQVSADVQTAALRRNTAQLALDARDRGDASFTTVAVIARYEQVTRLDPGSQWDWVLLTRLYTDAGLLADAMRAAERALSTSRTPRERSTSLVELGDVFFLNGDLQSAFDSYREALAIDASLANAGLATDADTSRDFGIGLQRMGMLALALGDAPLAYDYFLAMTRRDQALAGAHPTIQHALDACSGATNLHDAAVAAGQLDLARNIVELAIPMCQTMVDHAVADAVLPTAYLRWRHANILAVQGNLRAARQELELLQTFANQRLSADPDNVALALQAQLLAISFADLDILAGHRDRARRSLDRIILDLQSYVSTGSLAPTATAYIWRARVRLASIPGSGIDWATLAAAWPATRIQGDLAALDWHFIAAAQSRRANTAP